MNKIKQFSKIFFSILLISFLFFLKASKAEATVEQLTDFGDWTVPVGVTSIQVECYGAGGGGASSLKGGGGGAYASSTLTVTPGQVISYDAGVGGLSDTNGGGPDAGTDCNWNDAEVYAQGGQEGNFGGANNGLASSSTGDVTFDGGAGIGDDGGGGAGGPDGAGGDANIGGGIGGGGQAGNGGDVGQNGSVYGGGGGSGAGGGSAGNGADGVIVITYVASTPIPTQSSVQNSSSNLSPQGCNDTKPIQIPQLFKITTTLKSATLFFTPINENVSSYHVSYGFEEGKPLFGAQFAHGPSSGVISYTVNDLSPKTNYFFQVRGANGCTLGDSSNWLKANTSNSTANLIEPTGPALAILGIGALGVLLVFLGGLIFFVV